MNAYSMLGYTFYIIEDLKDVGDLYRKLPSHINMMGFDTETNTKINWAKKDENLIDIGHDKPFLLQFGYNDIVIEYDIRQDKPGVLEEVLKLYKTILQRSNLCLAHNIKFDISMFMNIGFEYPECKLCDLKSVARLALESKSEREGGYNMGLKPLAKRLLGSMYVESDKAIDVYLDNLWKTKLKDLATKLKPYKVSKRQIEDTLKDVTGTLDMYSLPVQKIFSDWQMSMYVSYQDVDPALMQRYAGCDIIMVLELAKLLLPIVADKKQVPILKREMELIMPLVRMERTGYTVDKPYLIKCKQALIFEINAIKQQNYNLCGVDLSPNQNLGIKKMLEEVYDYHLESTDKNAIHIAMLTDTSMPEPVKKYLDNVIYLRSLLKWISTYINPMLFKLNNSGDSKVYTQYDASGAVSGRFTSNFQQFPKNAIYSRLAEFELFHPRKMFVIDKQFPEMAYIDYSQVELRLQAEYTYKCTHGYGDVNMLRAYMPFKCHEVDGKFYHDEDNEEWKGVDLHTQSTLTAFPELNVNSPEFKKIRYIGKRVNFALIYGGSLHKIQEIVSDTPPEVIEKLYNGFYNRFKDVRTYGAHVSKTWASNGGYVTNLLGRRYYINESKDVYKLNNYLIQGSAADIIKLVIIRVDKMLRDNHYKTKLQGCIHDELCVCVAEGEHDVIYKIKHIMENTVKTFVPLVAEIEVTNTNWAEKHEEDI